MATTWNHGPVWFTLPENLDLAAGLPEELRSRQDEAAYLVDKIIRKTHLARTDRVGFVHLKSRYLATVMAKRTMPRVVEALHGNVIETSAYVRNVRCRGYRLQPHLFESLPIRRACRDLGVIDRVLKRRAIGMAIQEQRRLPVHAALEEAQKCLSIVRDEAEAVLETLEPPVRFCQFIGVDAIERGLSDVKVSPYGRIANRITNLKRELRPALRLDGQPLASVDLRNAQPALLGLLMQNDCKSNEFSFLAQGQDRGARGDCTALEGRAPIGDEIATAPTVNQKELDHYTELTSNGQFFDWLSGAAEVTRDVAKKRFLVDVLARRGRYRSHVSEVFGREFPGVLAFVRHVNRQDHATLIRLLQRMESWLVIEQACPLLLNHVPVVTLHDCLFCRLPDTSVVEQAFGEVFERTECKLSFKTESWNLPRWHKNLAKPA